jgi:hypothetical protein
MQGIRICLFSLLLLSRLYAQEKDLLGWVTDSTQESVKVVGAFKSTRVINGHSMEQLPAGQLDLRFLHRFGTLQQGFEDFFGLDQATMRFGLDYGISSNLTVGFGRSTYKKEWDAFIKYRILQQEKGGSSVRPVSLVWVSGATINTLDYPDEDPRAIFKYRMGYYNTLIIGRKFSEQFSAQVSPSWVHQNLVDSVNNANNTGALGFGLRYKISRRVALVTDYHWIFTGKQPNSYNPLSIGVDIETGGHVFQLHFSNATGMNERAYINETFYKWGRGEIRFGFNLSRIFTVRKNQIN